MYFIEGTVPAKRTRRSMAPSPSPAEGQASKPESTAIMSEVGVTLYLSVLFDAFVEVNTYCILQTYSQSMLCLCQVRSQLYVTITGSGAPPVLHRNRFY